MPAFHPNGKTFQQRLDAFLADAKTTHSVTVGITRLGTTKEWQQKYHVAHMFVHNRFNTTPAVPENGAKTIAWSHISNAELAWDTANWNDFLRTKTGAIPVKEGPAWKQGFEPDKTASLNHVKQMLVAGGIGKSGTAQVSSGLKPCGEPCRCSVGQTRHLSGQAADLKSQDLNALSAKLTTAKAGTLDQYMKTFGLHRPLLHSKTSPEPWHIEATN